MSGHVISADWLVWVYWSVWSLTSVCVSLPSPDFLSLVLLSSSHELLFYHIFHYISDHLIAEIKSQITVPWCVLPYADIVHVTVAVLSLPKRQWISSRCRWKKVIIVYIDSVLQDYQCHFWDILKLPLLFDLLWYTFTCILNSHITVL
jgi:hypothetical protein